MDSTSEEALEVLQSPSIRRSVRKKVQVSHYGHDTPEFSSPVAAKGNLKRQDSDQTPEHEGSDADVENTPESSPNESDDDEPLSTQTNAKKRRGKVLKKQPASKKAKSVKRKSRSSDAASGEELTSMFDIVTGGKAALQAVVDDWIKSYATDATSAMVDLIQFIIQCCGCKGKVTPDMLEEEENVNAIRKLTEEFDEESDVYPLSGQNSKKFKNNFSEFIEHLIHQCQRDIVYDDFMMEKLIAWIISLSDSQVRAFRHTSTLAGMKLVAALIQVALSVNIELDNTQRQLDNEKQKAAPKRGVQKMEKLQERKNQLRDNLKVLEEFMSFIFQGVFVHRYRDIRPEIRALCIHEIGCWMTDYSSLFLSHKYLKYVVWTLHDKVGDVRLPALQSLIKLYEVEEFLPQLEPLTSRFKGRIVSMTLDKQNDVAVEAIKLVRLLFSYNELDEEDCEQVEQLVYCSHPQIAHGAGLFLHERLLAAGEKSDSPSKKKGKKSDFSKGCEYMKRLIEFFISKQIHEHGAYIVDGLWQHCETLKEWQIMTSMLLEDACNEDLSDDEETALIEIMTCCCRQAATGRGPPGRQTKKPSTKEKRTIENEQQDMSAHFMEKLPALLEKYGTDTPKAENLVSIPQYFFLEEYTQRRLGKYFEQLLDQIDDLVGKGAEMSLLEECAKTYRTLQDNELTISSKAEVSLEKLLDGIIQSFQDTCTNLNEGNADQQDNFSLGLSLKRITAFYKSHNLGTWDLYKSLHWIADNDNTSDEQHFAKNILNKVESKIIDSNDASMALTSLQMLMMWKVHCLSLDHPSKSDMRILKQRLAAFVKICDNKFKFGSMEIRKSAFLALCDTLVIFAKQLKNEHPLLTSIVYQPSDDLQNQCKGFVNEYIFEDNSETEANEDGDNTEAEVEKLKSKRLVLAGFCKLIAFGIFEMNSAHCVFSKMISGFGNYGDLIKHTMSKCKEISKSAFTKNIALTLTQEFATIRETENGRIKRTSERLTTLKELAKRLSSCFGIDPSKPYVRTSMITLHREGILFAFTENGDEDSSTSGSSANASYPNMLFLDVMSECIGRLIPQDRKAVLKYLQDAAAKAKINLNNLGKGFLPLSSYYKVLSEDTHGSGTKTPKSRPLAQKAKRKLVVEENGESDKRQRVADEDTAVHDEKEGEEEEQEEAEGDTRHEEPDEDGGSPANTTRKTPEKSKGSAKRKRDNDEEEDVSEQAEENSEDEFQESGRSKPSSQVSWISSQPKRSTLHASVTYGRTSSRGRRDKNEETVIEEDEIEKEDSEVTPEPRSPQPKRTKKEFPKSIFEDSPAVETQSASDDDLEAAF